MARQQLQQLRLMYRAFGIPRACGAVERVATTGTAACRVPRVYAHAPCCMLCCTVTVAVLEVSCAHSATNPASAFIFHGPVGDGRASFGSMRGEAVHANAAHFSSVASPRALLGGSDASAPPVDLAALVQLTAWIKALSELIHMQDGADSRFVDARERAVSVLESWVQRWYDRQAMSTP